MQVAGDLDLTLTPLIGPKMYAAPGSSTPLGVNGRMPSTRLHLDLTDALNYMAWTTVGFGGAEGAEWLIFARKHTEMVERFLHRHFAVADGVNTIHSHQYYFDDHLLEVLWTEENVKPYRFVQQVGDVVVIPAGCAHQVRICYPLCDIYSYIISRSLI